MKKIYTKPELGKVVNNFESVYAAAGQTNHVGSTNPSCHVEGPSSPACTYKSSN